MKRMLICLFVAVFAVGVSGKAEAVLEVRGMRTVSILNILDLTMTASQETAQLLGSIPLISSLA